MKTQLIYQDETSNKFWNIVVEGNTHTVTFGRVGTKGTSKTKEFANGEAALKDGTKLVAAKKRKGYSEVTVKAKVIRDNYTLAGKPIKNFGSTINPATAVKVLFDYDNEEFKVVDKLEKLSRLSNISEMDTLVIGAWEEAHDPHSSKILEKLIEFKNVFSGLKHLFIGDMNSEECEMSWINQADYSSFYQHFPALETFGIRGSEGLELGTINLPNLKNLIIETGGMNKNILRDVITSDLKNLEHLELWLGTDEYGCSINAHDLMPILTGNYPNLKYLGLKNYYQQNDVAESLDGAPILKHLETLDLSMGVLGDKGAEALLANEELLNLKHINCRHHFISKEFQEKLKAKFVNQNINLNDAEEPWDGEYYYVEIGE